MNFILKDQNSVIVEKTRKRKESPTNRALGNPRICVVMETCLFNKDYFFNKFPIVKNISHMEIYTQRRVAIPKTPETAAVNTLPKTVVTVIK